MTDSASAHSLDFAQLADSMRNVAGVRWGAGVSPNAVGLVEEALDVLLPGAFADFLVEFGWLTLGRHEFFGLGCDAPHHLELVRMTLLGRTRRIPRRLVPLARDGASGGLYCLDTARLVASQCPVIVWDDACETPQVPHCTGLDYTNWLEGFLGR